MFGGGKDLDLGTRPGGRRPDVSVSNARAAPSLGQAKATVVDMAPVQVLARYNARGVVTLLACIPAAAVGVMIFGVGVGASWQNDDGSFVPALIGLAAAGYVLMLSVAGVRGAWNCVRGGRRALFIKGDRLVLVWPTWLCGFSLTADQIQSLEYVPNIPKYGPGIVLTTTNPLFRKTRVPMFALDVEPMPLVRLISDFAHLRIEETA